MKSFLLFATGISLCILISCQQTLSHKPFCRVIFLGAFGGRDAYGIHQ